VLAGLGSGLDRSGRLSEDARDKALGALERFRLLLGHMKVKRTHVVATAAIRDAEDGPEFVREIESIGLPCTVLSAEEEARLAGEGVLSGIPDADGIVGDLGGGSLELVSVADGRAQNGISTPLGVLRLEADASGEREARKTLKAALKKSPLRDLAKGRTFYMVGGSWRALARIDMLATDFPLPITHQYRMKPARAKELRKLVRGPDERLAGAASARLATSPVAGMLLELLVDELEPSQLVVSTYGIREGLLYSKLEPRLRQIDPLIEEASKLGAGLDWKTSLQELTANAGLGVPEYLVSESGPDHEKEFKAVVQVSGEPYGTGTGRSKKEAEQEAAASAWRGLRAQLGDAEPNLSD